VPIGAGELPDRLDQLPRDRPLATICASGYRSSVAASLLRAAGFKRVSWVPGGVPTWGARGLPLAYGLEDGTELEAAAPTRPATVETHTH
jgi:hydroxyacylglutathione hydrolase